MADHRNGFLGWVSFTIEPGLRVDGVAVRRTRDGRLTLSFPAHRDNQGRDHPYIRPTDDATRREVERQVLEALGLEAAP
jgi:hypothetical protein